MKDSTATRKKPGRRAGARPRPARVSRPALIARLRIVVLRPPRPRADETGFGLQDNSPGDWVLHRGELRASGDLVFTCECRVAPGASTRAPNFLGPFTHGPAARRFLYLSWKPVHWRPGQPEVPAPPCTRRMKINLSGITWRQLREANQTGAIIETRVNGTARDGGPACATVPLIGGWQVKRR